jgi:hypothetical protein
MEGYVRHVDTLVRMLLKISRLDFLAHVSCGAEIFKQSMGAWNRVGIGISYRPARLHRLAELIPGLHKSLKIRFIISARV